MKSDIRYKKIIDYVNVSPWKDDTADEIVIKQAYKAYEDIIVGKDRERMLFRICGQTGSGKTSQLLKSLEMYMEYKKKNPVVLGVRTCSNYHPYYNELLNKYGNGKIREVTNGFALKCMTYVLKLLIENGYLILLDITLLDPIYEEYALELLKENNYKAEYHIMAVNKEISDLFIEKRYKETGRVVSDDSCAYFNYILNKGLEYIVNNDSNNYCYVWNAFDKEYKFYGLIKDSYKTFIEQRSIKKELLNDEKVLLESKFKILKDNIKI